MSRLNKTPFRVINGGRPDKQSVRLLIDRRDVGVPAAALLGLFEKAGVSVGLDEADRSREPSGYVMFVTGQAGRDLPANSVRCAAVEAIPAVLPARCDPYTVPDLQWRGWCPPARYQRLAMC